MSLDFQPMPFVFNGGLNSKIDTFHLPANNLLIAENVRFQLDGSVSKRPGFVPLSRNIIGGGEISKGVAVQVFNNELLAFDGTFIYSYVQSVGAWTNRGLAISVINSQRKIVNNRVSQQNNPDATNLNGQECYVWEDVLANSSDGVRYTLIDSQTGAHIADNQSVYQFGLRPKVIGVTNTNQFYIYYCASYNTILYNTISTLETTSISSLNILFNDSGTSTAYLYYDVCLLNGLPLVAHNSTTGIRLEYNGSSHIIVGGTTLVSTISVVVDSLSNIWVSYIDNTNTPYIVKVNSTTFSTIFNPIIIEDVNNKVNYKLVNIGMIEDISRGSINVTYEASNPPISNYIINVSVNYNGVFNIIGSQRDCGLASKPFFINNQLFVNVVSFSPNQATYFTLCLTQGMKAIGKINPGVAGTYRNNGLLAQCDSLPGSTSFLFANQKKGAFTTNNNTSYSLLGLNASYINFNNVNAFNSVVAANNLHIVGGIEKIYDGVSLVEDNFNKYAEMPDTTGCTIVLASGGGLKTGQYQYVICYEWTDNNNLVERGQPSIPTIIQTPIDGYKAVLTIPTLRITDKTSPRTPVSIAVFRTIIQDGVPSSIFYKVTSDATPIVNDVTVDTLTFTDLNTDAQIKANEPLYTASQIFNSAPPSCSLISAYSTRLFISGLEDPNVIWTSQDRFQLDNYNTIPIEWSPLLVQGINPLGNAITAIQALDQAMVVFKEDNMFVFNGEGPNANGTSGGFSNAVPIPSDSGCINPNSIISIPGNKFNSGGLMYQSNKGIYLVDRSYINTYIGAEVEAFNSFHITSSEILNSNNEVIFTTLEGTVLVYNYYFNRWTTWSYLPAVDSCIWNNNLVLIQADGTILQQQENYWFDYVPNTTSTPINTQPIIRKVQTPWLAFAGIQGYQSVLYAQLLGHYLSPHIINTSVCYGYDPAPKEPLRINSNFVSNTFGGFPTFGAGSTFGGGPFTPYQCQINFGNPLCQSISLIISDDPLSGNNQGGIWSALTFQVGIFKDPVRLPAKNKFTGSQRT